MPDAWNGEVVYFAHGFRGNGAELVVQAPPIRDYLIQHGYAWAASSYSKNGYEPGAGARDTYALRDVFAEKVGAPKRSYIYGQSMGGHVVALSLEQYPTAYDGALSECGVVSGHEILDYLLSWAALAGYFGGADLFAISTDAGKLIGVLRTDLPKVLGPANEPTEKGKAFADAIEQLTGGPRAFFREGFLVNYALNFGLLLQAVAQPQISNAVAENQHTTYVLSTRASASRADELNRSVARIAANPAYRDPATYPEFADFTGKIQRPLLTIHGTGDLFVPISLEQSYRRIVDAAGAGDLLVQRAIRRAGHCTFSQEERIAAFEDLVKWVEQRSEARRRRPPRRSPRRWPRVHQPASPRRPRRRHPVACVTHARGRATTPRALPRACHRSAPHRRRRPWRGGLSASLAHARSSDPGSPPRA